MMKSNRNDGLRGKGPKQVYECELCKKPLSSLAKLQKHIEGDKCRVVKKANAFCMKKYNTKDPSSVIKILDEEVENKNKGEYDCKLCHYGPINTSKELKFHLENVCLAMKKKEVNIGDGDLSSGVNEEKVNEINLSPSP